MTSSLSDFNQGYGYSYAHQEDDVISSGLVKVTGGIVHGDDEDGDDDALLS